MVVPDALAGSADSYEVSGANGTFLPFILVQHVSFGPYRARARTGIDTGTQWPATLFNGDIERRSDSESAWFELRGPEGSMHGRCVYKSHTEIQHAYSLEVRLRGVKIRNPAIDSTSSNLFHCELREANGQRWRLQLNLDWRGPDAGSVSSDDTKLMFGPTSEQKNALFGGGVDHAGYLISDETGLVGAFDTGGHPRVWISRRVEPTRRELLAAICVALIVEYRFMH
jgi:hypothetical protein